MRKVNWKFVVLAFAAVVAVSGGVYAGSSWLINGGASAGDAAGPVYPPASTADGCYSTCGGEIPWPFQVSNQAVELSDGERYLLIGSVEIISGRPLFSVDLAKHPWLATAKRRENPRYILEGPTEYWKAFEGKRLRLVCTAIWNAVQDTDTHRYRMEVMLQSLADPAILAGGAAEAGPIQSSQER